MIFYWFTGKWTLAVTEYFVISLPVVVAAFVVGHLIQRRLKSTRFVFCIHAGLILIGTALLVHAIRSA